jgi:hypothetical protein
VFIPKAKSPLFRFIANPLQNHPKTIPKVIILTVVSSLVASTTSIAFTMPTEEEIYQDMHKNNTEVKVSGNNQLSRDNKENGNLWAEKRRLLAHRAKKCECVTCWREMSGLPPMQTRKEEVASWRFEEREIERAKKRVKKDVQLGNQSTISSFFAKK